MSRNCLSQACTEMVMLASGSTEESIFPASEYSYENQLASCKASFGVEPRPSWITTEFGGHVRITHPSLKLLPLSTPTILVLRNSIRG